ncbi:MAG: hypothetical protein EA417_06575, partial [Gammaproteobacteria bacterium]
MDSFKSLRALPPFTIQGISTMSNTPKLALVFAALLIALGLGAFLSSGSQTALLPAYPGVVIAILAGLALAFEGGRRHLM